MKKKILTLISALAIVLMVFAVTACGSKALTVPGNTFEYKLNLNDLDITGMTIDEDEEMTFRLYKTGGKFERLFYEMIDDDAVPSSTKEGTYTTSGNNITITIGGEDLTGTLSNNKLVVSSVYESKDEDGNILMSYTEKYEAELDEDKSETDYDEYNVTKIIGSATNMIVMRLKFNDDNTGEMEISVEGEAMDAIAFEYTVEGSKVTLTNEDEPMELTIKGQTLELDVAALADDELTEMIDMLKVAYDIDISKFVFKKV